MAVAVGAPDSVGTVAVGVGAALEGTSVGAADGVGAAVVGAAAVGVAVAEGVGFVDGTGVAVSVTVAVGLVVGWSLGLPVGPEVGPDVGPDVGSTTSKVGSGWPGTGPPPPVGYGYFPGSRTPVPPMSRNSAGSACMYPAMMPITRSTYASLWL